MDLHEAAIQIGYHSADDAGACVQKLNEMREGRAALSITRIATRQKQLITVHGRILNLRDHPGDPVAHTSRESTLAAGW
jgi:hypothetical protein